MNWLIFRFTYAGWYRLIWYLWPATMFINKFLNWLQSFLNSWTLTLKRWGPWLLGRYRTLLPNTAKLLRLLLLLGNMSFSKSRADTSFINIFLLDCRPRIFLTRRVNTLGGCNNRLSPGVRTSSPTVLLGLRTTTGWLSVSRAVPLCGSRTLNVTNR